MGGFASREWVVTRTAPHSGLPGACVRSLNSAPGSGHPESQGHLSVHQKRGNAEGWTDYAGDPERAPRVLTARGGISLVALDEDEVALVCPPAARPGVADGGCVRADVFVEGHDAAAFHRRVPHKEGRGFRLQPSQT